MLRCEGLPPTKNNREEANIKYRLGHLSVWLSRRATQRLVAVVYEQTMFKTPFQTPDPILRFVLTFQDTVRRQCYPRRADHTSPHPLTPRQSQPTSVQLAQ